MKQRGMLELALGWLAVALGVVVAVLFASQGYIAPGYLVRDLTVFGAILLSLAAGATLYAFAPSFIARLLLSIGTLGLVAIVALTYVVFLAPSAALAMTATFLALARPRGSSSRTRRIR